MADELKLSNADTGNYQDSRDREVGKGIAFGQRRDERRQGPGSRDRASCDTDENSLRIAVLLDGISVLSEVFRVPQKEWNQTRQSEKAPCAVSMVAARSLHEKGHVESESFLKASSPGMVSKRR
jgi:hypothetical protein